MGHYLMSHFVSSVTAFLNSVVVHLSAVAASTDECQPEDVEEPDMNDAQSEPSIQLARSVIGKLIHLTFFHDIYLSFQPEI